METSAIIAKIQNGLKTCSETYGVSAKDVQIKITNATSMFDSVKFFLMKGNENVQFDGHDLKLDIKTLLNLNAMEAVIVSNYLKDTFGSLAKKNNLDVKNINARIFTKTADFNPSVYLHEGQKIVKEITVEELTTK